MPQRIAIHLDLADRLLARERTGEGAEEGAAAAIRVYEKLYLSLAPLVGATGFRALFARSVKLTTPEFPFLGGFHAGQPEATANGLRLSLQGQAPEAIRDGAVALFGAFFALLATHIGGRLTAQVIMSVWPDTGEALAGETKRPATES